MSKKNIFLILAIILCITIAVLVFLSYMILGIPCGQELPVPLPATMIYHSGYITTDQGDLHIGQTYHHRSEGLWPGQMTLLYANEKEATFLFKYPDYSKQSVQWCVGQVKK